MRYKINAVWQTKNGCEILNFGNYYVKKESNSFYGVFDEFTNLITSGITLDKACKKAKLLQIGFDSGKDRF